MFLEIGATFGNVLVFPQLLFFRLLRFLCLEHGTLLSICDRAALRMELFVPWIVRDAENGQYPRETKGGFYAFGG